MPRAISMPGATGDATDPFSPMFSTPWRMTISRAVPERRLVRGDWSPCRCTGTGEDTFRASSSNSTFRCPGRWKRARRTRPRTPTTGRDGEGLGRRGRLFRACPGAVISEVHGTGSPLPRSAGSRIRNRRPTAGIQRLRVRSTIPPRTRAPLRPFGPRGGIARPAPLFPMSECSIRSIAERRGTPSQARRGPPRTAGNHPIWFRVESDSSNRPPNVFSSRPRESSPSSRRSGTDRAGVSDGRCQTGNRLPHPIAEKTRRNSTPMRKPP